LRDVLQVRVLSRTFAHVTCTRCWLEHARQSRTFPQAVIVIG
jgi:hypothetical protein